MKITCSTQTLPVIPMHNLKYGQLGRVVDKLYHGTIVFRISSGPDASFVRFQPGGRVDTWMAVCPLNVEVLPPGATVTLTVE